MMMYGLIVCLAVFVAVQANTTMAPAPMTTTVKHHHHHNNVTKEPTEKDNLRFFYDGHTHKMMLVNSHSCYIFALSDSERAAVHTDVGIRTLELKFLNMLATAAKTEVMIADQPRTIQNACGHNLKHTYMVAQ